MARVRLIEVAMGLLCAIALVCGVLSLFWIGDLALVFPALGPPVAALAIWRSRIVTGTQRRQSEIV
jgi:hypothetical protein